MQPQGCPAAGRPHPPPPPARRPARVLPRPVPLTLQEAVSCVSAQPLRHLRGPLLSSQLTHVKAAWMGLSPRCRGVPPGCYKEGSGRLPPTPRLTAAWRDLLGQCFGTDAAAPAALEPLQLLVIDRLYASGRWVG